MVLYYPKLSHIILLHTSNSINNIHISKNPSNFTEHSIVCNNYLGVYAVFIRLYIIAPLIALRNEDVKIFEALYDAWRVSKKHSKLLIIATSVAAIFLAITTVAPALLPKNIYTISALVLISSITLPIAKLMLADIGIKLLKKELA